MHRGSVRWVTKSYVNLIWYDKAMDDHVKGTEDGKSSIGLLLVCKISNSLHHSKLNDFKKALFFYLIKNFNPIGWLATSYSFITSTFRSSGGRAFFSLLLLLTIIMQNLWVGPFVYKQLRTVHTEVHTYLLLYFFADSSREELTPHHPHMGGSGCLLACPASPPT